MSMSSVECVVCGREACEDPAHETAAVVTTADIPWRTVAPSPWPLARSIVTLAVAHLPRITDDDTAALVAHLATAIVDQRDQLVAVQNLLAAALVELRDVLRDRDRIRDRNHALLAAQREAA